MKIVFNEISKIKKRMVANTIFFVSLDDFKKMSMTIRVLDKAIYLNVKERDRF